MKANFLATMALCALLIAGTGIAQYGPPSGGGGYGQGGYAPPSGGGDSGNYGPDYGSPPAGGGYEQGGYEPPQGAPPQNGQGFGPPQGQQGYNQGPPQGGYAPQGVGPGIGGFGDFRLGFEQGFSGVDPTAYVNNLIFLGMLKQFALYRSEFNLNTKCLETNGESELTDALVNYYNQSGSSLAQTIFENRKATIERQCNNAEQACSQGFNFLQGAPADVRKVIEQKGIKIDLRASPAEIEQSIQQICEAMMENQISRQQAMLDKRVQQMATQFTKQCEQRKQWEQQQQQWQNQGPQGPNGPGTPPQGGGYGQPPRCQPGQFWNGQTCTTGGQPPQQPFCGDRICNEAPETCVNDCQQGGGGGSGGGPICGNGNCESGEDSSNCSADCGQQGGGSGGGGGAVCGNSSCETGETPESCPGDCSRQSGGGGLAANVFNQMFGSSLYSFTALVNLLRLQEPGGMNCPPGEYPGYNDQRQYSCIRQNTSGYGGGYGAPQEPGWQPNAPMQPQQSMPPQGQQGYNQGPPQGGYGPSGGGFGGPPPGPGLGQYNFEEICDSGDIQGKIREEFGGEVEGMKQQMLAQCPLEAQRRASELSMMAEKFLINEEACKTQMALQCADGREMIVAFEAALANPKPAAEKIVKYKCSLIAAEKLAQAQRDSFSTIALELSDLAESSNALLGQEGSIASNATAMDLIETAKKLETKKNEAGVLSLILPDARITQAYKESAERLAENQKTVEDLEKQNLPADKKQKLQEIKEKLGQEAQKAKNCEKAGLGFFRFLSGC